MSNHATRAVLQLLDEYSKLGYVLDAEQLMCLSSFPISRQGVRDILDDLSRRGKISCDSSRGWYTVQGSEGLFKQRAERVTTTARKQERVGKYLNQFKQLSWVRLILLTGSCALDNASDTDDIDLMVVTAPNTMFLCRLFAHVLALFHGLRRRPLVTMHPDSVCINIWLDGFDIRAPHVKQNLYGAREIYNARILYDADNWYTQFLKENQWISTFLPNWDTTHLNQTATSGSAQRRVPAVVSMLNSICGALQLAYMKGRVTHEIVGKYQLWFHPLLRS